MKRVLIVAAALLSASPAMARHHHHHFRHHHIHHRHHSYRTHLRHLGFLHDHAPAHDMIVNRAASMGISRPVIEAVAGRESGFQCSPHNSRYNGPLQILASTARVFGYRGGSLNNCGAGLHFGLMHVAMCVSRYGNSPGSVVRCHARGF